MAYGFFSSDDGLDHLFINKLVQSNQPLLDIHSQVKTAEVSLSQLGMALLIKASSPNEHTYVLGGTEDLRVLLPHVLEQLDQQKIQGISFIIHAFQHYLLLYLFKNEGQYYAFFYDPQGFGVRFYPTRNLMGLMDAANVLMFTSAKTFQKENNNYSCDWYVYKIWRWLHKNNENPFLMQIKNLVHTEDTLYHYKNIQILLLDGYQDPVPLNEKHQLQNYQEQKKAKYLYEKIYKQLQSLPSNSKEQLAHQIRMNFQGQSQITQLMPPLKEPSYRIKITSDGQKTLLSITFKELLEISHTEFLLYTHNRFPAKSDIVKFSEYKNIFGKDVTHVIENNTVHFNFNTDISGVIKKLKAINAYDLYQEGMYQTTALKQFYFEVDEAIEIYKTMHQKNGGIYISGVSATLSYLLQEHEDCLVLEQGNLYDMTRLCQQLDYIFNHNASFRKIFIALPLTLDHAGMLLILRKDDVINYYLFNPDINIKSDNALMDFIYMLAQKYDMSPLTPARSIKQQYSWDCALTVIAFALENSDSLFKPHYNSSSCEEKVRIVLRSEAYFKNFPQIYPWEFLQTLSDFAPEKSQFISCFYESKQKVIIEKSLDFKKQIINLLGNVNLFEKFSWNKFVDYSDKNWGKNDESKYILNNIQLYMFDSNFNKYFNDWLAIIVFESTLEKFYEFRACVLDTLDEIDHETPEQFLQAINVDDIVNYLLKANIDYGLTKEQLRMIAFKLSIERHFEHHNATDIFLLDNNALKKSLDRKKERIKLVFGGRLNEEQANSTINNYYNIMATVVDLKIETNNLMNKNEFQEIDFHDCMDLLMRFDLDALKVFPIATENFIKLFQFMFFKKNNSMEMQQVKYMVNYLFDQLKFSQSIHLGVIVNYIERQKNNVNIKTFVIFLIKKIISIQMPFSFLWNYLLRNFAQIVSDYLEPAQVFYGAIFWSVECPENLILLIDINKEKYAIDNVFLSSNGTQALKFYPENAEPILFDALIKVKHPLNVINIFKRTDKTKFKKYDWSKFVNFLNVVPADQHQDLISFLLNFIRGLNLPSSKYEEMLQNFLIKIICYSSSETLQWFLNEMSKMQISIYLENSILLESLVKRGLAMEFTDFKKIFSIDKSCYDVLTQNTIQFFKKLLMIDIMEHKFLLSILAERTVRILQWLPAVDLKNMTLTTEELGSEITVLASCMNLWRDKGGNRLFRYLYQCRDCDFNYNDAQEMNFIENQLYAYIATHENMQSFREYIAYRKQKDKFYQIPFNLKNKESSHHEVVITSYEEFEFLEELGICPHHDANDADQKDLPIKASHLEISIQAYLQDEDFPLPSLLLELLNKRPEVILGVLTKSQPDLNVMSEDYLYACAREFHPVLAFIIHEMEIGFIEKFIHKLHPFHVVVHLLEIIIHDPFDMSKADYLFKRILSEKRHINCEIIAYFLDKVSNRSSDLVHPGVLWLKERINALEFSAEEFQLIAAYLDSEVKCKKVNLFFPELPLSYIPDVLINVDEPKNRMGFKVDALEDEQDLFPSYSCPLLVDSDSNDASEDEYVSASDEEQPPKTPRLY